jgi:hypothetical protein
MARLMRHLEAALAPRLLGVIVGLSSDWSRKEDLSYAA